MQSAPKAEAPHALIRVAYSNGRWRVTESGPRNAVSCFGERRDALDYATHLAEQVSGSLVIHKRPLGAPSDGNDEGEEDEGAPAPAVAPS